MAILSTASMVIDFVRSLGGFRPPQDDIDLDVGGFRPPQDDIDLEFVLLCNRSIACALSPSSG